MDKGESKNTEPVEKSGASEANNDEVADPKELPDEQRKAESKNTTSVGQQPDSQFRVEELAASQKLSDEQVKQNQKIKHQLKKVELLFL